MRKGLLILSVVIILLVIVGCKGMPPGPEDAVSAEDSTADITEPAEEQTVDDQEVAVEEKKKDVPAEDTTAETDEAELKISGNLGLQKSLELCPHLAGSFDCDKYDLRRCDFKMTVGKNEFYPDLLHCRSGYDYRGENPAHKYCFIQECRPLEKENIVYGYGGTVVYAEYIYSVDTVDGGIMTHYTLDKCGEELKEFPTSYECRLYKSELRNI
ncbi:hypothetical protein ACFL3V_04260 [Nanoarchaeota archaeon]